MKAAVLISIQPKWCAKIASGEKTVEVRKTAPKIATPFKCYIYETQGKTEMPWMDEDGHMIFRGRGMVIGEFVCDEIRDCREVFIEPTCLTVGEWIKYTDGYKRTVWGWHISDLKIYDQPKSLTEFRKPCICPEFPYCPDCPVGGEYISETELEFLAIDGECSTEWYCNNVVKKPPQSWCYVQEAKHEAR